MNITRLILTNDSSSAGGLGVAQLADFRIGLERQLVWGRLPSDNELKVFFGPRRKRQHRQHRLHWLDSSPRWRLERIDAVGLGLIEFCARYDAIDLWIDPHPNDQLQLVCLLHCLAPHPEITSKLTLLQADSRIADHPPEELAKWRLPAVKIGNDHLELAGKAWRAFGAPTPQHWFDLLEKDLSVLPRLKQAILELLEELPGRATGVGATELRMLELISEGNVGPFDVFPGHQKRNARRVYGYWEVGALLDGLTHCPAPAVSGLDEGPFTMEMHDDRSRHQRYNKSKLSLSLLGEAILAGRDDFSRHNPIRRWWGGTELTNDRLWRWDPAKRALLAP
ncbi:MAG: hypothetical protein ACREDL_01460 [Bradyrhizobium sp.]